jgi:hypothetical protein
MPVIHIFDEGFRAQTRILQVQTSSAISSRENAVKQENVVRILCPYCRWEAVGTNLDELRKAKDEHGTHECPLPEASAQQKPDEGLQLTA